MKKKHQLLTGLVACAGVALLLVGPVAASGDNDERDDRYERGAYSLEQKTGSSTKSAFDPLYAEECGACHVVYPPGALPARSWEKMMGGLSDHFGDNAELEPIDTAALTAYLVANSAEHARGDIRELSKRTKASETPLRITELRYFKKEHDEIPSRVFKAQPDLKLANCEACHTKAEQNSYRERDINIPGFGPWDD
jgi:hypothetical protein